ncbi:TIFY 5A [Spatholobus suberectus]|nr:TIFY 5A [Spatholobus suberectus]
MRKHCNLELRLFPPSLSDLRPMMEAEVNESPQLQDPHHQRPQQPQYHPLTIFYDGKICVSDVTELQARSILMLANKEMEKRVMTPTGSEPSSPILQSPHNMYSPGTGLSMKRSLQRFLQKRKNRVQETSPYNH